MIKVALVGYGHLGRWHLEKALSFPNVKVVGVVDPDPATASKLEERGQKVPVYKSTDEIIDKIDAAIVVTPTSYHFDITKKLILNNKHVFCEKPMTSTFDQALEIKDLLKDKDLVFQVGHSERFHKVWSILKEDEKFLQGDSFIEIERQGAFKGRATDVDVVQDLMIHDLDIVNFLLKEKPITIETIGHKVRTDFWDHVTTYLTYPSGKRVQITSGRNYVEEVRTLKVLNKFGSVKVDLLNCKYLKAPHNTSSDTQGSHVISMDYEKRDHLLEEQKYFYEAIENNKKAIVDIDDGVSAVELVSLVLDSLEEKKKIILSERL